jgi:hypothetical protein
MVSIVQFQKKVPNVKCPICGKKIDEVRFLSRPNNKGQSVALIHREASSYQKMCWGEWKSVKFDGYMTCFISNTRFYDLKLF